MTLSTRIIATQNLETGASVGYGASFGGMMTLIRIDPPNLYDCVAGDYQ